MGHHLAIKKNKMMPFAATQIQLESIILSEVSKKQKDKYQMTSVICGISNMTEMSLSQKQIQGRGEHTVVAKGEVIRGGMKWEVGFKRYKLLYMQWINNQFLLVQYRKLYSFSVNRTKCKRTYKIYIYIIY